MILFFRVKRASFDIYVFHFPLSIVNKRPPRDNLGFFCLNFATSEAMNVTLILTGGSVHPLLC